MFRKILQQLIDRRIYTCEELAAHLGTTPLLVIQAVNTLQAYGVQIEILRNNRYRLTASLELLEVDSIRSHLSPDSQIRLAGIEVLDVVDSTNHYLLNRQLNVNGDLYACIAEYQTAGRGRQGHQWISPYASGLCLSLKGRLRELRYPLPGLNIALAIAIVRLLHLANATEVYIKWPNDICWQGSKLAGLLLESRSVSGNVYEIVMGMGMNVYIPTQMVLINQPWTDLTTLLGYCPSRNSWASRLIDACIQTLERYLAGGLVPFLPEWQQFDGLYGRMVTLHLPNDCIVGVADGIDEQGALWVQTEKGRQRYTCGEVSVR